MTPPFPNSPVPNRFRRAQWKASWSKRNGVHYVGDDVIIDLTYFQSTYNTFHLTARFDMGTNGATIATTDRGYYGPFTAISGTPTYSNTQAHSGTLSCKIDAAASEYVQWSGPSMAGVDCYRLYLYATANPTSQVQVAAQAASGLHITTAGKPRPQGSGGVGITMTNSIALNQWVRLEGKLDHTGGGSHEAKLFNDPDSSTPTETISISTGVGVSNNLYRFGATTGTWGTDFWIDDLFASTTSYPGPFDALEPVDGDTLTYTVRDYFGNTVTSGTFSEAKSWFVIDPPAGGWDPGWYRCYITGPDLDPNFYYYSYGCTNFCVIRNDANFTAMPAGNTSGGVDQAHDFVMKGVMGLGTSRLTISNAEAPTTGGNTLAEAQTNVAITKTYWSNNGLPDAERPAREPWLDFPNGAVDGLTVAGAVSGNWGRFYVKDGTVAGDQVFIQTSVGTDANTDKVQVFSPDSVTLVETYDNLDSAAEAQTAINTTTPSAYIRFFNGGQTRCAYVGPTAIGKAKHDGVVTVVSTLYPDVKYYEGPQNEPGLHAETAHNMLLFADAVHDGNASAKAIGPASVNISDISGWTNYFNAGGGTNSDGISFHAYNGVTNGDMNLGKNQLDAFTALISAQGLGAKELWQTESTGAQTPVYRIYHPRRARKALIEWMLFEQYGVPRERNNWWYDISQGFWDVPVWSENGDGSLEPQVVLGRVFAEETWGKAFDTAIDFGNYANNIFLGSLYTDSGSGDSVLVLMMTSYMQDSSLTFDITGTSGALTVVDGFGVETSTPQHFGKFIVEMTDIPCYIRLPSGISATLTQVNDWLAPPSITSLTPSATTKQIDGVSQTVIANDDWMTIYPTTGIAPATWATPPSEIKLLWGSAQVLKRVLIWCGPNWQNSGSIHTFTIDTTPDGSNWTTRQTVTQLPLTYFEFGTDSTTAGCFLETFWDEQWIFDVLLPDSITCTGVRVSVSAASYGGEPLSTTTYGTAFGQGNASQAYRIEEVAAFDEDDQVITASLSWIRA